ncbi:Pheromone B alpha 3 receptor [Sparassis crispa]|uniref:Pheromone B alpha 3 receptor n=1 Tax=Sparassis crispa TaxID=139825 RepID=A0A401GXU1_9APHY|nr:Pheromone B alpha 3 receptor [Sparassis crispa]GBE87045.1 Pheromone B alpha 3 receptor [Sparassis crispa]
MSAPTYPLFPVFALLGFVLALIPLPWHLEAYNTATCYFIAWSSLACLNQFINSVVWANTSLNIAPIWCDISTRIITGAAVGLPAASLCINRRLYMIARLRATTVTRAEKRRAVLIDSLICVLFPIVCMVLEFIVQGHRFNIYEEIGCSPATYNTLLAYFLVNWWPVVIGLVSAVYCVLSLRAFAIRRAQFREFLTSNHSSLSFGRYFRLMALATTELLLTVPISSYLIYLNATTEPLEPWVSWSYVHYDFSRVEEMPAIIWRMNHEAVVALTIGQWLNPISAFIFFGYFGLASEARRHYKLAFCFISRCLRLPCGGFRGAAIRPIDVKFAAPSKVVSFDALPAYSASSRVSSRLWDSSISTGEAKVDVVPNSTPNSAFVSENAPYCSLRPSPASTLPHSTHDTS